MADRMTEAARSPQPDPICECGQGCVMPHEHRHVEAESQQRGGLDERKQAMKGRVGRYGWFDHDPDEANVAYECESDIDRCEMHPNGVWASTRLAPQPSVPPADPEQER